MKVVNIAKAMIKLQFNLPQTLISRGFTRRTVLHAPAFIFGKVFEKYCITIYLAT